jgi:hypothetical protein
MLGTVIGWRGSVAPMLGTVTGCIGSVAPMLGTVTGTVVSGDALLAASLGAGGTRKRSSGWAGLLRVAVGDGSTRDRSSTLRGNPRGRDPVGGVPTVPGMVAGVGSDGTAVGGIGTAEPVTALWACARVAVTVITAVSAIAVASIVFPIMPASPSLRATHRPGATRRCNHGSNTNASDQRRDWR